MLKLTETVSERKIHKNKTIQNYVLKRVLLLKSIDYWLKYDLRTNSNYQSKRKMILQKGRENT